MDTKWTSVLDPPVSFDIDGDGDKEDLTWVSGGNEGIPWIDLNGDGKVSGGPELFGAAMLKPNGSLANHGFQALKQYDGSVWGGNSDGWIDSADDVWADLKIWLDFNQNGKVGSSESFKPRDVDVKRISVDYTGETYIDVFGNEHLGVGTFKWRGGSWGGGTGLVEDIFFVEHCDDVPNGGALSPSASRGSCRPRVTSGPRLARRGSGSR